MTVSEYERVRQLLDEEESEDETAAVSDASEIRMPREQALRQSDDSDAGVGTSDDELLRGLKTGVWLDAQSFPALRYAVPKLVPEGFALLVGPPKAGKSWLALDMLLAVAGGGITLGRIAIGAKRRVLYLALEDGDRRMQDRCRKLLGEEAIPEYFHYLVAVPAGRVLDVVSAFLRRYPDTGLIVIDTLGKVMPPALAGESAYQRDYRVGGALKRLADSREGLALVVLHHDRKAGSEDFVDSVSGTHGLAGAADTVIVLARRRQSADGLLKVTGRDVMEAEYALKMGDGVWQLDGATLVDAANNARRREDAAGLGETSTSIIDFVRKHPEGVRAKDVAQEFGKDAYQYLKRQAEAGRLVKLQRGLYAVSEASGSSDSQLTGDDESDESWA